MLVRQAFSVDYLRRELVSALVWCVSRPVVGLNCTVVFSRAEVYDAITQWVWTAR